MDTNVINEKEHSPSLPLTLTLAFAEDTDALVRFTSLSVTEQDRVIRRAESAHTKKELKRILSEIR